VSQVEMLLLKGSCSYTKTLAFLSLPSEKFFIVLLRTIAALQISRAYRAF
jgi:hypothetical protein